VSTPIGALYSGVRAVASAAAFLRGERRLWGLCIAPILTTSLLFALTIVAFFGLAFDPLYGWLEGAIRVADPQAWWEWLWVAPLRGVAWLLRAGIVVVFFGLLYLLFVALGGVVAAPFLDLLSRRVEEIESRCVLEVPVGFRGVLWSMGQELRRASFLLLGGLAIVVLGWIPGGQLPAVVAAGFFTAFFVPLEYTGFVLDRRALSFRQRRSWLWRHRFVMLGFGATAMATFLVPVVNFLCLPLLVTAGTRLALELDPGSSHRGSSPGPPGTRALNSSEPTGG